MQQQLRDELLGMTVFDLEPDLTPELWRARWRLISCSSERIWARSSTEGVMASSCSIVSNICSMIHADPDRN